MNNPLYSGKQVATIDGITRIYYYLQTDLTEIEDKDARKMLTAIFEMAKEISTELNIQVPGIGITPSIRQGNPDTGEISILSGISYSKFQLPYLKESVILLSSEDFDPKRFIGVLAHEMRHLWQDIYRPDLRKENSIGYRQSLYFEAEIDADAYAIYYIASKFCDCNFEIAANLLCPLEKAHDKSAYEIRLNRAITLYKESMPKNFLANFILKLRRIL